MKTIIKTTVLSTILLAMVAPGYSTETSPEQPPMGQNDANQSLLPEDNASSTKDLFGTEGGYFHPFIRVEESYTDNVFYEQDEVNSWITRFIPGIWVALPRTKELPTQITPSNSSPAGLQTQIQDFESGTERYQGFALANLESYIYSEDSDLNSTGGQLQGLFRYNMRGGLSLQALDVYRASRDPLRDTDNRNDIREYDSNLVMGTADYLITEKFRVKADYSNFWLDYDKSMDDDLNRDDNAVDLFTYFNYSPKTAFFLEYKYVDVSYDTADEKDNTQNFVFSGIDWKSSEKLVLMAKVGYQNRDYDDSSTSKSDWDGFAFELITNYQVTEKTLLTLSAYRNSNESDNTLATNKEVTGIRFGYRQDLTEKIALMFNGLYEYADYTMIDDSDRSDDRYYLSPGVEYYVLKWLMFELDYSWDKRTSDIDTYEYTSNMVSFSVNCSL